VPKCHRIIEHQLEHFFRRLRGGFVLRFVWCRIFAALAHHKRARIVPAGLILETDVTETPSKLKEEEKMKADKKPIDNEELQRAMNELLKGSDDEDTNTNNGGSSGEEDQDHFSEVLQRHSSSKMKLRSQDPLATNHCNSNRIWQQQRI
jgi:hypothetical protein